MDVDGCGWVWMDVDIERCDSARRYSVRYQGIQDMGSI